MDVSRENLLYWTVSLLSVGAFYAIIQVLSDKLFGSLIPTHHRNFSANHRRILASGLASTVNAVIMFTTSLYLLTHYDLHKDPCEYDSFAVRLLLCIQVGYFIADTISVVKSDEPGKLLYLVHHVAMFFQIYFGLVSRLFAVFVCLRGLNEFSVPFMHTRWLLGKMNKKGDMSYFINGLMFLFAFFFGRVCVIPVFFYVLNFAIGTPQWERLSLFLKIVPLGSALVVDSLNVYWFGLLAKGAYALISNKFGKQMPK